MEKQCVFTQKSDNHDREPIMTISREEFNSSIGDLHKKIDVINTTVTQIDTTLKVRPTHEPPCKYLEVHLSDHKATKKLWYESVVQSVIGFVVTSILTALATAWALGAFKGHP